MTAITSGTYPAPLLSRVVHQAMSSLFARIGTTPLRRADALRQRIVQANRVRALARSVELSSPGFASDLYAAASRHEND